MSEVLAIGLMSGTSLDGVDAALVRISDAPAVKLVAFRTEAYSTTETAAIRHAIRAGGPRELALLSMALGERFAAAVLTLCADAGIASLDLAFVASHGQTIWHEPGRASLQIGDAAVIAERVGVPVVSGFRSRDVAAGGQGAPLVPLADVLLFGREDGPRILLNVGGMANLTYAPRRGRLDGVVAFDTGPGVAVINGIVHAIDPEARFDRDGERAARGRVVESVLDELLGDPYFDALPPKSTGREHFGDAYAALLLQRVRERGGGENDAVATATSLTIRTVARALDRFVPRESWDLVVSGGGANNPEIMRGLRALTPRVSRFGDTFFDGDAKEAVAFALLGWCTMRGRAGNVPDATGAQHARVLGTIHPA